MRRALFFSSLLFASSSSVAFAQPQEDVRGGPGESCRARSDCKEGLKCVAQVCSDEHEGQTCGATSDCGGSLKCVNKVCTSGTTPLPSLGAPTGRARRQSEDGGGDWLAFQLEGAHPFVGLTLAGGFTTIGFSGSSSGGFNTFNGDFIFALNGGVFFGRHQLKLEIAPVTYFWDLKARGPAFSVIGSYGYLAPLYESQSVSVYWPLRTGVGLAAGPDANMLGVAWFQVQADLIGTAIQVGHVLIDLHLPTFRYALTDQRGTQGHNLSWMFGASISYVF